jgi:hypothetical protein
MFFERDPRMMLQRRLDGDPARAQVPAADEAVVEGESDESRPTNFPLFGQTERLDKQRHSALRFGQV